MPFNRGFDIPGDLALTADGRDLAFVSGAQKVVQNIKVRASIFKGSWRYDRSKGVPYFQEILAFGAGIELVRRRFYELLIETDGVLSVTSLVVTFDHKSATIYVAFTCSTDDGVAEGVLDFVAVQAA